MFVISRTPVRISFFGGSTDYPDYYLEYGGAVLGVTIDKYIIISVKASQNAFFDHSIRLAYSRIECVKTIDEIEHPSVRESMRHHAMKGNFEIQIFSDLPAGTGLGSSSAFTVGFLRSLHALKQQNVSKFTLAEEACHVEQKRIGEAVGSQDPYHAAFGGWNLMEFSSSPTRVFSVPLTSERLTCLEKHLMLFYTGITRQAPLLAAKQIEGIKEKKNTTLLHEIKAITYEALKCMVEAPLDQFVPQLGSFLHQGWLRKQNLCAGLSPQSIDLAYEAGMKAGAYGGKLCGAGGGGFLLFLADPEKQEGIRKALSPYQQVPIRFEQEGSKILYQKHPGD